MNEQKTRENKAFGESIADFKHLTIERAAQVLVTPGGPHHNQPFS